jgi:uncharacterized membrane protein
MVQLDGLSLRITPATAGRNRSSHSSFSEDAPRARLTDCLTADGACTTRARLGAAARRGTRCGRCAIVPSMDTPAARLRHDRLDALRGVAIVWMALFHFAFDLNHFGLITPRQLFTVDTFWTTQRTCIVSLFLFCAGVGQAVALDAGQAWPRFWRRWAQVAGCAVLVSIGSAQMFPRSWIHFGVLHGIAVMLILLRLLAPLAMRWLAALAMLAIALPWLVRHPWFDSKLTNWVGLVTRKPVTEDFVPVLPWLGVMLFGLIAGRWLLAHRRGWLAGAVPPPWRWLPTLGRWSLSFYMLHQPVLIGAIKIWLVFRA